MNSFDVYARGETDPAPIALRWYRAGITGDIVPL